MQTYQAFVFTGRGESPGAALQQALDRYTAWITAQVGDGVDDAMEPTIWIDAERKARITRLDPYYAQDPYERTGWPWSCDIGVIAQMRGPARPVEGAT